MINMINPVVSMIFPFLWIDVAAFGPEHIRARSPTAPASLSCFFFCLLDLIAGLLSYLLDLANRLVGLALRTKFVVAGQSAGGFLESTFRHVCFPLMLVTPVVRGC